MNVVDSSAWLEYLAAGPNADFFAAALEDTDNLVVPTLSIYEVFKLFLQRRSAEEALAALSLMHQGVVVDCSSTLAVAAAKLSVARGLPLADSIILATAQAHEATLWTQDADFEGMDGVEYRPKAD